MDVWMNGWMDGWMDGWIDKDAIVMQYYAR